MPRLEIPLVLVVFATLSCSDRAPGSRAATAGHGGVGGGTVGGGSAGGAETGRGGAEPMTEGASGLSPGGAAGASSAPRCGSSNASGQGFVHPGGLHTRSNLQRMRYQVQAQQEPWFASFQSLSSDARASADYVVQGDPSWTSVQRGGSHGPEFEADATAAYLNALLWAVTADEAHAQKSVEIFNTWKNLTLFVPGGTPSLDAGLYAYKLVEAAELIRGTYDGWATGDMKAFQDMLVYPGYSSTAVPASVSDTNGTFYWRIYNGDPGRHGNQDLIAWRAMLVMGVFLDNRLMFERALRYFKGLPHLPEDLPYVPGPSMSGAQLDDNEYFTTFERVAETTISDYGYNGVLGNYVWENGQLQESSRDQEHALLGLGMLAGMAEIAWNQGDDVWNALDQRLLKAFEFSARYNASYLASFADQKAPWEPTGDEFIVRTDRTGRWLSKSVNPHFESDFESISRGNFPGKRPVFEQALAHFRVRMGLEPSQAVWTERARDLAIAKYGQEPNGFSLDHPGWGGLTFRRPPECAGDPVSGFDDGKPVMTTPVVPAPILAANYDYFPGAGEGHTYHDLSSGNGGGQYRADDVDLGCGDESTPVVIDIEAGEWLSYTIEVPEAGPHGIELEYSASTDAARVSFRIDGGDATAELSLPSTSGVFESRQIASGVELRAGVQAVVLQVAAAPSGFSLRSFKLQHE